MSLKTHKISGANPLNLSTDSVAGGRAGTLATEATWSVQDAFHLLHSVDAVGAGHAAHAVHSLGQAVANSMSGLLGIAAGTGLSAYVNHLVHGHHEKTVTDEFRPELAAITGKPETEVNVSDLYNVARSNPSLDEDLDRNRGMRNLRTASTLIGSTVAFVAVVAAVSFFPPMAALGAAAASAGIFSGAALGFIGASMALSYGVMHTVGRGFSKIGQKLLGYNKPNVSDHVAGLDKLVEEGKNVSPEKVMGVFVAASPQMQNQIENTFGTSYDKLATPQQLEAERVFGNHLPLEGLSAAINNGQMSARELIFTVHGQASGAYPVTMAQPQPQPAPQQQPALQPEQVALSQAPENEPITANQWRDMVEKQRAEQQAGIGAPTR